jgi:pimeloyl-ACP methyl ester carboxylesterase
MFLRLTFGRFLTVLFVFSAILSRGLLWSNDDWLGYYEGSISIGEEVLEFRLVLGDDGLFMDIPAQGVSRLELVPAEKPDTIGLLLLAPALPDVRFKLLPFLSEEKIKGVWHQHNTDYQVTLTRFQNAAEGKMRLLRPQEPKPPFPYRSEEVTFESPDAELSGTLTIPKGKGPFPAAVLVTGSGPQNRDEEIFGHKPFLVLADYLSRRGFVVLRYDDRGVGASGGVFAGATTFDFSFDAWAALRFLRNRKEVDRNRTGIIGHSEGALVAAMLGSWTDEVKFVVMMAGTGLNGRDVLRQQREISLRAAQKSRRDIIRNEELFSELIEQIGSGEPQEAFLTARELAVHQYSMSGLQEPGVEKINELATKILNSIDNPWMQYFMNYEPTESLSMVTQPVLALFGSRDTQVPPYPNASIVYEALSKSKSPSYRIKMFNGLNHLFQHSETGMVNEYQQISQTISPKVLEFINDWLTERF